jgi:molybdopterin-containing oxidoreductase family membrane subunit
VKSRGIIMKTSGKNEVKMSRIFNLYNAWLGLLIAVMGVGAWAYFAFQFTTGLIVTGMRDIVVWGLYIITFIFFIGLSAGGLIISSSSHVFGVERWKPISRLATLLAFVCVAVAGATIIADLGRPDRALNLFLSPQLASPFIWDLTVVTSYLVISLVDLWFMCRVDFARKHSIFALGTKDVSDRAVARDKKMVKAISFVALPAAIMLHSVTAWIFGLQTARPWWNTAILAPVFLASAMVSGLALIILVALIARRRGILDIDLNLLYEIGKLLAVVILVDFFLKSAEILTMFWPNADVELARLSLVTTGPFSPLFLIEWTIGGIVPLIILAYPRTRKTPLGLAIASILLVVGVFAYRIELILPGFVVPLLSFPPGTAMGQYTPGVGSYAVTGTYTPTWVEYAVTGAMVALGAFIVTIGAKVIPFRGHSTEAASD